MMQLGTLGRFLASMPDLEISLIYSIEGSSLTQAITRDNLKCLLELQKGAMMDEFIVCQTNSCDVESTKSQTCVTVAHPIRVTLKWFYGLLIVLILSHGILPEFYMEIRIGRNTRMYALLILIQYEKIIRIS